MQPTWGLAAPAPATPETKRVLILYSQEKGHPAHDLTDQGIRAGFAANPGIDVKLYTEYLDVGRFPDPGNAALTTDYLRRKYAGLKFDGIIAVYPAAMDFLQAEGRALFPGIPVVACEINRSYAEKLDQFPARSFSTGVILGDNATKVITAALQLKADTRYVALVAGTTPNDVYSEQIIRQGLTPFLGKLDLIDLTKLSMEETLSRVSSLPPQTIVFYSTIFIDGAGQHFVPKEALARIAQVANAPIFGLYESYFGHGIVGGKLISFQLQGRTAAELALRVMSGESPAAIPFAGEEEYVNVYDWRELKRWQIPVSAIPAGAETRYREPTLWEEYRWYVIGAVSLAMVEALLIFGLGINLKRRKKAERELMTSESSLRSLSGKLLTAQEEERSRIARELHDDITQRLAVLAIDMGKLELQHTAAPGELKSQIGAIKNSLVKISEDIHAISRKLHPAILDDLGLVRAIQSECAAFTRREGVAVTFRHEAVPEQLPKNIALAFYRIIQESLRNIARHSQAESAHILVNCTDKILQLSIADSGVGLDPLLLQNKAGLGLISMAERVKLVQGTITVDSVPGEGTVINVQVPIEVNAP